MSPGELEELGQIIAKAIKMDHQGHTDHHEFIEAMMEREQRKQERWEKIQTSLIGSVALIVLGSIGKLILMGVDHWVASK